MFNQYVYKKLYNSQKTTDQFWDSLSTSDKNRLLKLVNSVSQVLKKCQDPDSVYSILMHILENKIDVEEKEVLVKQVFLKQNKPFEKFEKLDDKSFGETNW